MVVQTSGTTGAPKTVEHRRDAVLASIHDTLQHWDLKPGTRALLALPTSFVAGQAMVVRAIEGAWDLELIPPPPPRPGLNLKISSPSRPTRPMGGWTKDKAKHAFSSSEADLCLRRC